MRMYSTVISREQLRTALDQRIAVSQRIAVKTLADDDLVGTFTLPTGLKNGMRIRLSKATLQKRLPGDHAWPDDGVIVRIRIPDWRLRNGLAALFVLAGLLAEAWPYAAALAAIWGIIGVSAWHNRKHAVDRFDPAVPWRFWPRFRGVLAGTAMLYLVPIGIVIALYLSVAAVLRFVDGAVTTQQLITAQRALSAVSDLFGDWIKLKEGPMFLALVGVYLLTCLLLAWRGGTVRPGSAAGRLRDVRYGLARALNRIAAVYARYSGPVAATLATLASFTFLTTVPGALATQLRLQAVATTDDYIHAAEKVEAELSKQVVSQLSTQIQDAMPPDYQQALTVPVQVERIREQADRIAVPLHETNPDAEQRLAAEEDRIRSLQDLPYHTVVDAPRGGDSVAVPDDLTAEQEAAARAWVESSPPDNRVTIISDSGREAVLQLEKVASEQGWNELKRMVGNQFPLAAPMVDALAEACDAQLQETLRQKVPAIVRQIISKVGDVRASIAAAASEIVATVDVPNLVRGHITEASRLAADLKYLRSLEGRLKFRADVVDGVTRGLDFDRSIDRILRSSRSRQTDVVEVLRAMVHDADPKNATIPEQNAATAITTLGARGCPVITDADVRAAAPLCGCGRR